MLVDLDMNSQKTDVAQRFSARFIRKEQWLKIGRDMSIKAEGNDYSLDAALKKLENILRIISEGSKEYYLKRPAEVDNKVLKTVDMSFIDISNLAQEFADHWFNSKLKGPDAIQSSENLDERVDIKLYKTGKLDFEHMKKIMIRLNRIDDVIMGLERITFYLRYYEDLCRKKELSIQASHAEMLRTSTFEVARETISTEGKRLQNQIERCNLYYQPAIKTKTLWVAVSSLIISTLAFLLTILKALSII